MILKKSNNGIRVQIESKEWDNNTAKAIIADIKEIRGRKYDRDNKVWIVPYSGAGLLDRIAKKYKDGKVNLNEYSKMDLAKDNPSLFPVFCPHCHKEIKGL